MLPTSERWDKAIRQNHTKIFRADLFRGYPGDPVPHVDVLLADIPILAGTITDDRTSSIRRRCNLTIPGTPEVMALLGEHPNPGHGGLWPVGNEIKVRSGILYDDGTEETFPMGVFRVASPQVRNNYAGDLVIELVGYDRSRQVSRARFTTPWQVGSDHAIFSPAESYQRILYRIMLRAFGGRVRDVYRSEETDPNAYLSPYIKYIHNVNNAAPRSLTMTLDDDPWQTCENLALAIAEEVQFDQNGDLVSAEIPDPARQSSVFDFVEGEEATFTDIGRLLDDERAYNGVVVTGESATQAVPVQAQVWDTNRQSPTYYDPYHPNKSAYGPVPYFYTSQYIETYAQALATAHGLLRQVSGFIEQITFNAIPNPALESGDVVTITNMDTGVNTEAVIQTLNFGLGENAGMNGMAKRRRYAVDEADTESEVFEEPSPI